MSKNTYICKDFICINIFYIKIIIVYYEQIFRISIYGT